MSVNVNGNIFGPARGKNKKEAEQAAASIACKSLIN
jgi:dsRNA-specific ribonuclease